MNGILLVVLAIGVGTAVNATPVEPFIGGGASPPAVPEDGLHTCMLIAVRIAGDLFGNLGGGSIISHNRILTSADLVSDAAEVRIWFYRTDFDPANRFQSRGIWTQPSSQFVVTSRLNDIAVVTFNQNIFFPDNIIKIVLPPPVTAGTAASVISYGFTTPGSVAGTTIPLESAHTVDATCPASVAGTATHFCATATTHFLCPGDLGSGIFTGTGINRRLIGVCSLITPGCNAAGPSAFTDLNSESVRNFLMSQDISPLPDE